MNKAELIEALSAHYDGSKTEAAKALNAVVQTITYKTAAGEKVTITGFGVFEKVAPVRPHGAQSADRRTQAGQGHRRAPLPGRHRSEGVRLRSQEGAEDHGQEGDGARDQAGHRQTRPSRGTAKTTAAKTTATKAPAATVRKTTVARKAAPDEDRGEEDRRAGEEGHREEGARPRRPEAEPDRRSFGPSSTVDDGPSVGLRHPAT